jgi:hypothetical protein
VRGPSSLRGLNLFLFGCALVRRRTVGSALSGDSKVTGYVQLPVLLCLGFWPLLRHCCHGPPHPSAACVHEFLPGSRVISIVSGFVLVVCLLGSFFLCACECWCPSAPLTFVLCLFPFPRLCALPSPPLPPSMCVSFSTREVLLLVGPVSSTTCLPTVPSSACSGAWT